MTQPRKNEDITQAMRDSLIDSRVTLDGEPAAIKGRLCDFPRVVKLNEPHDVEYSWVAVWRIVTQRNGEFKS